MSAGPIRGNQILLRQGLELLSRIPVDAFRACPRRSSVGAQYRHILDHYVCLLDGLCSGDVDYDARQRDHSVESDPTVAAHRTNNLLERLAELVDGDLDRGLQVHLAPTADSEDGVRYQSTVGRELLFLISHTVHHFAIIRLQLDHTGVPFDAEFGMAPSTLAFHLAGDRG